MAITSPHVCMKWVSRSGVGGEMKLALRVVPGRREIKMQRTVWFTWYSCLQFFALGFAFVSTLDFTLDIIESVVVVSPSRQSLLVCFGCHSRSSHVPPPEAFPMQMQYNHTQKSALHPLLIRW